MREIFPSLNGSLDELAVDCSASPGQHLEFAGPPIHGTIWGYGRDGYEIMA